MDTLSPTLLAAQQAQSGDPFVLAMLEDRDGAAARLRLQSVYTGSEPESPVAACIAPDGSLIRVRRDGATLYASRLPEPGIDADFSVWSSLGAISSSSAGLALCAGNSSLYLLYVHIDGSSLRVRTSSDNGVSWNSPTTITTAGSAVSHLALAVNPFTDDIIAFWTTGADVWSCCYTSSWSSPTSWGKSSEVADVTGIAAFWRFDVQLAITGVQKPSDQAALWTTIYGDDNELSSDTWGSLQPIDTAAAGSGLSVHGPAVTFAGSAYRMFFLEHFSGDVSYRRIEQSWSDLISDLSIDLWREFQPLNHAPETTYGPAAATSFEPGQLWLVTANSVWLAELDSIPSLDVSAEVIAATIETGEYHGSARVELDNADGHLTHHPALRRGMRLNLTPGYHTGSGPELPAQPRYYWIDRIDQVTGPQPRIVLHGRDGWSLLERWRARRQYTWPAGSALMFQVLRLVLARAGLRASAQDASATLQGWEPALTISPGENGLTVVKRLLSSVSDCLRFQASAGVLIEPQPDDAVQYHYGQAHAIIGGRYVDTGPAVNRTRVVGLAAMAEAFDYDDAAATGERASSPIVDLNLFDDTLTANRAAFELRAGQIRSRRDEVRVFGINCGQELYDVVSITDPQAGLENAKRRVLGMTWRFETLPRRRYEMTLTLGEV